MTAQNPEEEVKSSSGSKKKRAQSYPKPDSNRPKEL
jgi:hypothetical protein